MKATNSRATQGKKIKNLEDILKCGRKQNKFEEKKNKLSLKVRNFSNNIKRQQSSEKILR